MVECPGELQRMPYLVRIGAIEENVTGVGSRGYWLFRRGCRVIRRWGAVLVLRKRRLQWADGYYEQTDTFTSTAEAVAAYQQHLSRLASHNYSRLPSGAKITLQ